MSVIFKSKILNYDENGNLIGEIVEYYEPNFMVSNSSLRVELIKRGLFDVINDYIMNSNDLELKTLWEYSNYINVQSPLVLSIKSALNMSDDDYQDIFISAYTNDNY